MDITYNKASRYIFRTVRKKLNYIKNPRVRSEICVRKVGGL